MTVPEWSTEEARYSMILDRLFRYRPEQRAEVLFYALKRWCCGCGQTYDLCMDEPGCCGSTDRMAVRALQCRTCKAIDMDTVEPLEEQ